MAFKWQGKSYSTPARPQARRTGKGQPVIYMKALISLGVGQGTPNNPQSAFVQTNRSCRRHAEAVLDMPPTPGLSPLQRRLLKLERIGKNPSQYKHLPDRPARALVDMTLYGWIAARSRVAGLTGYEVISELRDAEQIMRRAAMWL